MIIVRLLGGLGNQMFQYAAGLSLAETNRTTLKLDVSWFKKYSEHAAHNRYALSCFNITEQFATDEEIDRCRGFQTTRTERWALMLARKARFYRYYHSFKQAGFWHREDLSDNAFPLYNLQDGTYLDGMFQSEKNFESHSQLLRLHFSIRYPAPPDVKALEARIRSGPSIALHFRRGDYISNPTFAREIGVVNLDYYHKAHRLLREHSPTATTYIFSDDIESVAREFHPEGPHEFVRCVESWHPWDTIRLMSLCNHLAIANSTFSWWAAWLNCCPEKIVIAPDPWFVDNPLKSRDIVPASWQLLPR